MDSDEPINAMPLPKEQQVQVKDYAEERITAALVCVANPGAYARMMDDHELATMPESWSM